MPVFLPAFLNALLPIKPNLDVFHAVSIRNGIAWPAFSPCTIATRWIFSNTRFPSGCPRGDQPCLPV
ncbi:hypothetical protein Xszus_00684 [Xenorhabdus szentirmaii]|nr:hypothetical protein Xsze_03433 [Xenorhabdus szentirmaii DSM 16338]PHM41007.1 hypothetical protein Xszus_00684 [Xenorhabdus szentirmaii]